MAGFSSISSPDQSAIDQILAEAMDHCVLEQVAAINCSSFSHSILPSYLETRFQKLKTFPSCSKPKLAPDSANSVHHSFMKDTGHEKGKKENSPNGQSKVSNLMEDKSDWKGKTGNSASVQSQVSNFIENSSDGKDKMVNSASGQSKVSNFIENSGDGKDKMVHSSSVESKVSNFMENPGDGKSKMGNSRPGYVSSPSEGSSSGDGEGKMVNSPHGYSKVSSFKGNSGHGKGRKGNSQSGSVSFDGYSSDSDEETAKKGGCFWCSPKRVSKKGRNGSRRNDRGGVLGFDFEENDEILSDLRTFSSKEQRKRMRDARIEEEKINKEAEKIVKWAKQVSARMEFSVSGDELSDVDDNDHHFGLH